MKKNIIILFFMCVLSAGPVCGGEENGNDVDIIVPPGMETIKEGDVNLVVYKGWRMRKHGDVLMTETTDDYVCRKFSDMEERFKKIEKELEAQKKELEGLKDTVKRLDIEEDGRKK